MGLVLKGLRSEEFDRTKKGVNLRLLYYKCHIEVTL